tara:strand:+ start:25717 stop:27621 length:1905 start_codon:yes stop_codon:yes gene_type:complete
LRLSFHEVKNKIAKLVPKDIDYSVDLEAATVAIITSQPDRFGSGSGLTGEIAKEIKRRVVIRPDKKIMMSEEESVGHIKSIIPEDAGVNDIYFDPCFSEVILTCDDPGTAVGRRGENINKLRDKIGWIVKVERTPSLRSKTVVDIRGFRKTLAEERRKLLRDFGRNIFRPKLSGSSWARLTALGSYREVGRACHLITTNESRVMIDVGANIADTANHLPFFNAPEALPLEKIDAVVLTHAHLDHAGMLPLLFKYGYKGPVYCTPPTRDMMLILQSDYLKVAGMEGKSPPYEMEHVREAMKHVIDVNWKETTDITPDIKMTMTNSGHIIGSSACHFHIGEGKHNLVFSGDQKYEKSWLFDAANSKFPRCETLVLESTYGAQGDFQPSRLEATSELQEMIKRTIGRNGKMILPVFAVGRSQEVMIAIDELFRNGEMEPCTVYLDGMIQEATAIHASHPEYLTRDLRNAILKNDENNPFSAPWFRTVQGREMRESILLDPTPCIVLATSGMLTGGPVMTYFRHWSANERNALCFVGYQAEGSIGRRLQKGFSDIQMFYEGETINLEVNCEYITIDGFSGHSDRKQLLDFVDQLNPKPHAIVCHHGDYRKCSELGRALREKYNVRSYSPKNLETIRLF